MKYFCASNESSNGFEIVSPCSTGYLKTVNSLPKSVEYVTLVSRSRVYPKRHKHVRVSVCFGLRGIFVYKPRGQLHPCRYLPLPECASVSSGVGLSSLPFTMASLGEDLLATVNKLQDLVFNTIGNDSLDLPQIVSASQQYAPCRRQCLTGN